MCHEHATHAPVELLEIRKTAPTPELVLQDTPAAFNGIEIMPASGGPELSPKSSRPMGQRRGQRVRPVAATAVDDHHHLFPRGGKGGHDLMDRLPKPLGITLRDDFIEDFGGAILDRPNDTHRGYASLAVRIKKGIDSRLGGDNLCLSHCGYTSWPCGILPT